MARNSSKSKRRYDVTGFTLVELVITIAVLAILSGIGALGYSGYITKANEAADQVLIGAVNEAFASACEEQGVDRMSLRIDQAKLDSSASPAIKGISYVFGLDEGTALENFKNAFAGFFEGNEETPLKVISIDDIHFANGVFIADEAALDGARTQQAIGDFHNSNFNNDIEGLVDNVEGVTSLFSLFVGNGSPGQTLEERLNALSSLGVDVSTAAEDLKKLGLTDDSSGTEVANAMVLYVAQTTSAMKDTSELVDDIMSGSMSQDKALMELPMMIGMYTAYYNSDYASQNFKQSYESAMGSAGGVLGLLMGGDITEDAGYADYKDKEMRADLEGYLGALRLVDQNKDSVNIEDPNAFSNKDFMDLIKSVLGN